jgi:hypothetical protein
MFFPKCAPNDILGVEGTLELAKFVLLIGRTSSIYMGVRLKALASLLFLSLISFCINSDS